jgi:leucine dehydrogenase
MNSAASLPPFTHEQVRTVTGQRSSLTMTVAIHSSALGTAIGGCRIWNYPQWVDSVADAMQLSAAMTLKNAAAGLNNGGGKCVICVPEGVTLDGERRRDALLDLGDLVESFEGGYRTGQDVGTTGDDMRVLFERTPYILGLPRDLGGPGSTSEPTARGIFVCLEETLVKLTGSSSVTGRRFVVSGLGQVGSRIAALLAERGALLFATDIDPAKAIVAERLGASWVNPWDAHETEADVYIPAGIGGIIRPDFVDALGARSIVGPANNQLSDESEAAHLAEQGILYAPDFVVNAGGAIFLSLSYEGTSATEVQGRVHGIGETLRSVFELADEQNISTLAAAESIAASRLNFADRERSSLPGPGSTDGPLDHYAEFRSP